MSTSASSIQAKIRLDNGEESIHEVSVLCIDSSPLETLSKAIKSAQEQVNTSLSDEIARRKAQSSTDNVKLNGKNGIGSASSASTSSSSSSSVQSSTCANIPLESSIQLASVEQQSMSIEAIDEVSSDEESDKLKAVQDRSSKKARIDL